MSKYRFTTIRAVDTISVVQIFMDGSRAEVGRFLLPRDGEWRRDVDFLDDIVAAYKKRYKD